MKKIFYYFTFLITVFSFAQTKVGAVHFNDVDKFGEAELMLNGAGSRDKLYALALYLDFEVDGVEDGIMVAEKDDTMAITLKITSSFGQNELNEIIRNGLEVATDGNSYKLEKEIRKFIGFLPNEIKKFDIFRILHTKGGKLSVFKNKTLLGTMESPEFKTALFKIWLGDNPVDYDLKESLLAAYEANPILGKWKMIDKKTGVALSVMQLYMIDNKIFGAIERMLRDSERDDVCYECTGEDKNKKIEGMVVIKGLRLSDDKYVGGTYTNIRDGKVSDCQIWTEEERRNVLFVKYKGSGGIHEWRRVKESKK